MGHLKSPALFQLGKSWNVFPPLDLFSPWRREQSTSPHGCQKTCLCKHQGSVKGPKNTGSRQHAGLKQSVDRGKVRAISVPGTASARLSGLADDVMRSDRPAPAFFNNEACGLKVSLLSHKEMGGKEKRTLLKREDQRREETDCPGASTARSCLR